MLKVEEAKKELEQKDYAQIQTETAWKWASRAAACFEWSADDETDSEDAFTLLLLGEEYLHEAIEHAALCGDDGALLRQLLLEIAPHKQKAFE